MDFFDWSFLIVLERGFVLIINNIIYNKENIMAIENLEKKLNGEIPVTRRDLDELIKSWGGEQSNDLDIDR